MKSISLTCALACLAAAPGSSRADEGAATVQAFLAQRCIACHGADVQEADLRLDSLGAIESDADADLWLQVAERVSRGEMPPDDAPQPDIAQRQAAVAAMKELLVGAGRDVATITSGPTGAHLDHDLIFTGNATAPLDNPPRLWRYSPEIYASWILRDTSVKNVRGQAMTPLGGHGFQDQAATLSIDEGTLSVVMRNAAQVAATATAHTIVDGQVVMQRGGYGEAAAIVDPQAQPTREQLARVIATFARYRRFGQCSAEEIDRLYVLFQKAATASDNAAGLRAVLIAMQLQPEALFRLELGLGPADDQGRRMLAPRELAYALSFALGDRLDRLTADAAANGQLKTRDDVEREVRRLLAGKPQEQPRVLRFFQEYFGYTRADEVFKDKKLNANHHGPGLVTDTDKLVLWVLASDRDVFKQLLTTTKTFAAHAGVDAKTGKAGQIYPKTQMWRSYGLEEFPETQPVDLPADQRSGILTQPSWLVAHSTNFDNNAIRRGKWIREHLLGGTVPDLPITVNAQLPEAPHQTLRERMVVTREQYCWQCHRKMNPLGLVLEQYDHFGRFRTEELVVDPTKPPIPPKRWNEEPTPVLRSATLDTSGAIDGTGDAALDGPVADPIAMLHRIADSPRARQVFVRHAFRYWMGRDENLGDAATLRAADEAYVAAGGSMHALILSLLTSDSFLYRTLPSNATPTALEKK